ncbi:unnamed protein product [Brassicogethes aeneus]|uniref:Uncharacterized protein n=1 Tax=Brassicogethes aeneus TaxID=1431903 RepID=A0A9P0AYN4_BRAAE|nr:unnamed protein product [Brassicogethes aeneus]
MIGNASSKLLPHFVISLKASDDFLNARVMALPESQIQNTHYDEKGMIRRLAEFRANNTEDNSMLNFFDEIEIHPIIINIEDDDLTLDCILEYLSTIVGEPNTFGLTPEEEVELNRLQEENERLREEQEKLRAKAEENECQIAFQDKMEEWTDMLQKYQKEEEKVLTAKAEPLRFYLMRYVFPVLIRGLVETAKVKPPEPLTFLAEFLFKENPEGKMFDPSYTEDGETLLVQYETNIEGVMLENIPDA